MTIKSESEQTNNGSTLTKTSTTPTTLTKDEPLKKIIIRRLPPTLTQAQFLEIVSPLPEYDYFYYCRADLSLGPNAFCRAYICFLNVDDVFIFKEKFDNYVFVDSKSNEYPAMVEFAPYQRKLRNNLNKIDKKDSKCNTIDQDPEYQKFVELLEKPDEDQLPSCEVMLEQIEQKEKELQISGGNSKLTTPLLEYLKKKKEDRRMIRDKEREMRKKRDDDRKKRREDEIQRRKDDDERRRNNQDYYGSSSRSYQRSKENDNGSVKIMSKPSSSSSISNNYDKQSSSKPSSSYNNSNRYGSSSSKSISLKSTTLTIKQTVPLNTTKISSTTDSANKTSSSSSKPSSSTTTSSVASQVTTKVETEAEKKERIRNKDRPSIAIYNPAERAAQRKQQQKDN